MCKAEAAGLQTLGQPALHSETFVQKQSKAKQNKTLPTLHFPEKEICFFAIWVQFISLCGDPEHCEVEEQQ